jgi:hypothetical protein
MPGKHTIKMVDIADRWCVIDLTSMIAIRESIWYVQPTARAAMMYVPATRMDSPARRPREQFEHESTMGYWKPNLCANSVMNRSNWYGCRWSSMCMYFSINRCFSKYSDSGRSMMSFKDARKDFLLVTFTTYEISRHGKNDGRILYCCSLVKIGTVRLMIVSMRRLLPHVSPRAWNPYFAWANAGHWSPLPQWLTEYGLPSGSSSLNQ